jgi:hypothetical protein
VIIQNLDNEAWFTHQFSFNIALQSGVAGERYVFWTEQNSAGRNLSLTMVNTALARIS